MISSIRLSWAVRARLSRFMLGIIDGRRLRDFSTEGEGAGGEGAGGEDDKKKELFKTVNDASPVSEGENSFRGKANSEASDWGTKTVTGYSFDELLDRIAAAQLHRDERIFQSQPPAGDPQRRNRHRDRSQERRTLDNIDELVDFLTEENARDVCVIRVPPEREYVEYFVVCSGLGTRHIHTMAENLAAEVKWYRGGKGGRVSVDGRDSDDWTAVDLGFTVVHMMLDETRRRYELEKLWLLGPEYDDQTLNMLTDRPPSKF